MPPPLTEPTRRLRSMVPETVTGRLVLTPPPLVAALMSNRESAGTVTVIPPPEVGSRFSPVGAEVSVTRMEPPEVLAATWPLCFSIEMPPPEVLSVSRPAPSVAR